MIRHLHTIDAHVEGAPLRLIVHGFPVPRGQSMREKVLWLRRRADHLRKALVQEPRGHADMVAAVLTPSGDEGADAGVLFMHAGGYSAACGHGIAAVVTIALERGLLLPRTPGEVVLDTGLGPVTARAVLERQKTGRSEEATRVRQVVFESLPAFVLHAGVPVNVLGRTVRLDVAFGGEFFAIVDAEALGLAVDGTHLLELRRAGMAVAKAVETACRVQHPLHADVNGIDGVVFMGPPRSDAAHLRNVTVFADGSVDRSPCGTATAAVMAVLDGMGMLPPDTDFVHEGIIDTRFHARIAERVEVGELPALVTELEASAWITGEHHFLVDDDDPLREGFRLA